MTGARKRYGPRNLEYVMNDARARFFAKVTTVASAVAVVVGVPLLSATESFADPGVHIEVVTTPGHTPGLVLTYEPWI